MRPQDWNRVGALFDEALKLPASEREAFVATLDPDEVADEVRSLLAAHDDRGVFDELSDLVSGSRVEQLLRLQPGEILGPYRIVREIASGGMAVVYEAEDLKHEREVAIKVLRPELAALLGAERFVGEMKTTAKLQHPNILALFDSGQADGLLYYVMPYIDGETLRERLDCEGQLSVEEAVSIATEVADALDYAHRHGVIHRDIKPGNILLQEGRPLVSDFGIALVVSAAAGASAADVGIPLGTPSYMSPEQTSAERELTPKTDIYSLGCVLYEMLAGQPPHTGTSAGQIIRQIEKEEPQPITKVRKTVPRNVAAALGKALQKLPADRFGSAGAFGEALTDPLFSVDTMPGPRGLWNRLTVGLAMVTVLAVTAGTWGWMRSWRQPPAHPVVEFTLSPPGPDMYFGEELALSPDGQRLVAEILTEDGWVLYERTRDSRDWRIILGTAGGRSPFFSADGEWLGYFSSEEKALKKVPANGGPARTIAQVPWMGGATWGPDNTVVFQSREDAAGNDPPALSRVSAAGGVPVELLKSDSVIQPFLGSPQWLPNGKVLLFRAGIAPPYVWALSLESGRVVRLTPGMSPASDRSDRVLYTTLDGTLVAQAFDPETLTLQGSPRSIAEDVAIGAGPYALYAVSTHGATAYLTGSERETRLLLVDRGGEIQPLYEPGIGSFIGAPRFSPNGEEIAFIRDGVVWVYSMPQGTARRLSFEEGVAADPAWTRDGRSIGYSVRGEAGDSSYASVYLRAADGTGRARQIVSDDTDLWELEFAPGDSAVVLFSEHTLVRASLPCVTGPEPLIETNSFVTHGTVSPDGRWIAYRSNESGVNEVYVRSYPDMGPATIISVGGGSAPAWSSDGQEIFYWSKGRMHVAAVVAEHSRIAVTGRTRLFHHGPFQDEWNRNFDVHPGGQHFVMVSRPAAQIVWRTNALPTDRSMP